ncbi:putative cytochrome P450 oxidoreductase OrdA-like protein [Poronia punctata]|nr:putative cytochrome P450 oxidoreductase OrdA-like protein [Poronia punctata]
MALNIVSLVLVVGVSLAITYLIRSRVLQAGRPPLPPGPKGLPVLGNLNDLPKPGVLEAHHWLEHKKLYGKFSSTSELVPAYGDEELTLRCLSPSTGPISSVTVLGQSIIIINDAQLAFELLEKRSAKYSSRPNQVFSSELYVCGSYGSGLGRLFHVGQSLTSKSTSRVGWANTIGMSPYNKRFRAMRKNLTRVIGSTGSLAQFNDLQLAESAHFLLHVLRSPDNILDHVRKAVGAVVLKIAYGYNVESHKEDVLITKVGDAMDKFARSAVPGAFMVDLFPLLNSLPDWVPGTAWKKTARQWGAELTNITEVPYAFVKHQMAQGNHETSFLARLIETGESDPETVETYKWSASSLYTAGADTTVSAIACFYLAMTLYPEVQKRAQEEIDRVIGRDRVPTLADRENLPYVDALVKETLRWHPVAPMGLPHQSTEDDVVNGYFIPKGSMLFANVWHFTHDPEVHPDPLSFKPERFLAEGGHVPEPEPHRFVFGFGRRICPGNMLAERTLYLTVAQSLAVFDISKTAGVEYNKPEFQSGVVSHPAPYKTTIQPRSPHHEALIKSLEDKYPWKQSDGRVLERMAQ